MRACNIMTCRAPHYALGFCSSHYNRRRRYGTPETTPSREIDEVAVERAVRGHPPGRLTIAEREEVVRRLHRLGLTDAGIAKHLDVTADGVWVIRHRLGLNTHHPKRRAA